MEYVKGLNMKFIHLILLSTFLFANNITDLINKLQKDTPEYSLGLILQKKITNLKFTPIKYSFNIKTTQDYIVSFNKLIFINQKIKNLKKEIDDLNQQIDVLTSNKAIIMLQKLYYKQQKEIAQKELEFLTKNFKTWEKQVFNSINLISFDIKNANNDIQINTKNLQKIQNQIEQLKIDLQKWKLLNTKPQINKVEKYIKSYQNKKNTIYQKLFNDNLVIWSNYLKIKNKKAFDADDILIKYSNILNIPTNNLINDFEKDAFGSKYLVYGVQKEINSTFQKIINILNYPLFSVGNRTITPINFFIFLLVLVVGWFIGKYYKKLIYSLRIRYQLSHSTATLLANMGYYILISLSFLIALKVVGLDLSSLAIIAGALSVGIGFGLQNIVSNFVSGIILMFERSIKVGDYIQIDTDTRGEILDISMRSTIIRTNDNINLIIPNQSFIQNNVINWTLGDDIVRFRVPFGVAYGTDIDQVENVVLQALESSKAPYIRQHKNLDTTPYVVFMEMGDSSLNFELFIWVKGEYARRPRRTRSEFLKMIYNALNEANITIPFPQQDLYIKESVPFEIKLK